MKLATFVKATAFAASLSALAFGLQASEIAEGIIVEGESLPIGLSIGDTRAEVDATITEIPEFSESYCRGRDASSCVFTAFNESGEKLGTVIAYYRGGYNSPDDSVSSLRWDFPLWATTTGVSLDNLKLIEEESELTELYPSARQARVITSDRFKVVLLRSPADGVLAVYSKRRAREGAYGIIHAPR